MSPPLSPCHPPHSTLLLISRPCTTQLVIHLTVCATTSQANTNYPLSNIPYTRSTLALALSPHGTHNPTPTLPLPARQNSLNQGHNKPCTTPRDESGRGRTAGISGQSSHHPFHRGACRWMLSPAPLTDFPPALLVVPHIISTCWSHLSITAGATSNLFCGRKRMIKESRKGFN